MESDTEEYNEGDKNDDRDCQEKFLQLRKNKEQLEDYTAEIEAKMRKKKNTWKKKRNKKDCMQTKAVV